MKGLAELQHTRVLVVSAHFDDETLFCGGTLRRLQQQRCEIGVVVTASVTVTNKPHYQPLRIENESARQHRRLVAFGRVCGMLDVSRTFMLETHNCRPVLEDESVDGRLMIRDEIRERLLPVLAEFVPDVVVTHGSQGEYGHGQHVLTHQAVRQAWHGPTWCFDKDGEERVSIDLDFKRRLLDCYRYGTTQDPIWAPYWRGEGSKTEPWLGSVEPFSARTGD